MRLNARQTFFALVLITPVVLSLLTVPPFVGEPSAQGAGGGGMVGPLAPIVAGGTSFYPTRVSGSTYKIDSPWDCSPYDQNNQVTLGGGPPYTMGTRNNWGDGQNVTTTQFTSGGLPIGFRLQTTRGALGDAALVDTNGDGVYDTVTGSGTRGRTGAPVNFSLALQLMDNNRDGKPDHVSLPWAEVAALDWIDSTDSCNDSEPQVWVPLADTTGDGRPDSIVLDLNGDGTPDPEFFRSPMLVPPAVPATNWPGLIVLATLLASLAIWVLARRAVASTPA